MMLSLDNMKLAPLVLISCLVISGIFLAIKSGGEKSEINECIIWQRQAKEIVKYTIPDWAEAQCAHYNMKIK